MAKSDTVALQQKQIANLIDAINLVARAETYCQIVQDCQIVKDCRNFQDKYKFTDKSKCSRQVKNFILRINLSIKE